MQPRRVSVFFVFCGEVVGFFAVYKKSKKGIRLILGAQKTNRLFATPPTACRLTTESLCGAEITGDGAPSGLASAVGDIKDALHHMKIGDDLGGFFTFHSRVTAGELWYHKK